MECRKTCNYCAKKLNILVLDNGKRFPYCEKCKIIFTNVKSDNAFGCIECKDGCKEAHKEDLEDKRSFVSIMMKRLIRAINKDKE